MRTPENTLGEIRTARTTNSKQFILPGGNRKIIASVKPAHFQDEKGRLYEISPDALVIKEDTDEYVNNSLPFHFTLHRQGIGYTYVSRTGGEITITLTAVGDTRINPLGDYKVTRTPERLTFHNAATDTDIVFHLHRNGLRTYRVLRSANAPREWRWSVTGDHAGLAKISNRITGKDASGKELAGLTIETKGNECLEVWDGTAVSVSRDRIKSLTSEVRYPITIDPDVTENIAANLEDSQVQQYSYPNPYVCRFEWNADPQYRVGTYFRFTSVAVDQGQPIALAELILNVTVLNSIGTIYGLDEDTATALTALGGWSGATRTTASTTFNPGGTGVQAFDVTSIVQEIVDRGGWATGNNLGFICDPTSGSAYSRFEDVSDAGTDEAQLEITFGSAGNRRRRALIGA